MSPVCCTCTLFFTKWPYITRPTRRDRPSKSKRPRHDPCNNTPSSHDSHLRERERTRASHYSRFNPCSRSGQARPVTVGQRLSLRVRTTSPSASSRPTPRPGLFTRFCTRTITTAQHQAISELYQAARVSASRAVRHERCCAGVVVDGGRLLRDAGEGAGRPGPVAGGVLVVGVPVAAVPPRRARAAARRARGPGAPRRVAPPARRRRVAGRVHGRGVAPLRRVPGAPPRRSRRRELRGKRRPARVPAHAGALQPPPLPTGR
jgi:hypothetical protein